MGAENPAVELYSADLRYVNLELLVMMMGPGDERVAAGNENRGYSSTDT
jgi:hypothetical protein